MDQDHNEIDIETATDEESRKKRDFENEISSIKKLEDKKLILSLIVSFLVVGINELKPNYIPPLIFNILMLLVIFGGIGMAIFQNIRKQRCVMIKYGLKCKNCGFIPPVGNASGVLGAKKCIRCRSNLNI